ncbi:MAG: hypothetical protein P1U87_09140 [Verrucomicrobiales bacterium]|nr:hypothetical protein [Verrucomicrobiales bacterium]
MKGIVLLPIILLLSTALGEDKVLNSPEPIRSYEDILDVLPEEMEPWNARHWSSEKKVTATAILREKVIDARRPVSMQLRAEKPQAWPGLTLYIPISNSEGYPIHLFMGLFADDDEAVAKLASLTPGDTIQVDGYFQALSFRELWGKSCLSLCIEEGRITRLHRNGEPQKIKLQKDIKLISAAYGSADQFVDVTKRVARLLQEPDAKFYVRPYWLGVDPAKQTKKALVITYRWKGKREIRSVMEHGEVTAGLLRKKGP